MLAAIVSLTFLLPSPALAQDSAPTDREALEEEMFGGGDEEDDREDEEKQNEESEDKTDEDESDESDEKPPDYSTADTRERIESRLAEEDDTLAIGGQYFGRLQYTIFEEGDPEEFPLSQPNILDVYLDGRPNDRLRVYTRGRLVFDPTTAVQQEDSGGFFDGTGGTDGMGGGNDGDGDQTNALVTGFGGSGESLSVALDQLWLKFDIARELYVTIGRQQVRWGVGRFWFPNDFLFAQKRDPVAIFDERTGVDLVKLHYPVESLGWNFYAVANLGNATNPEQVGGAGRAEFLVGQTEFSLSAAARTDQPLQLGFDISTGLWLFDLRAAVSVVHGVEERFWRGNFDLQSLSEPNPMDWVLPEQYSREDEWIPRVLAGAEIGIPYGNDDTLYLGAEYFFDATGYGDPDIYPWLIFQGQFRPFYVGRHYGAFYALLAAPGQWDDHSFTLATLGNLSDRSFLTRLDYRVQVLTHLSFFAFGNIAYGRRGEFNLRLEIPAIPAAQGLDTGVDFSEPRTIPATRAAVGLGFQLDF